MDEDNQKTDVGLCIAAAIALGKGRQTIDGRTIRLRMFNYPDGFTIMVSVPARNNAELEALDAGKRLIPWSEFSARAHELPDIVAEAMGDYAEAIAACAVEA